MGQFSKRVGRKPAKLRVPIEIPASEDAEELLVAASQEFVKRANGSVALHVINAAHALLDRRAAAGAQVDQQACASGCAYCCHMPVTASVPEALLIHTYVRERWSPDQRAALDAALEQTVTRQAKLDDDALFEARERCVFLGEGERCQIYAVRPLACRGHASFSRERCADSFADPSRDAEVPVDEEQSEHKDKLKTTVALTSYMADCQALEYELQALLLTLSREPKALSRWLQGLVPSVETRSLEISRVAYQDVLELAEEIVTPG